MTDDSKVDTPIADLIEEIMKLYQEDEEEQLSLINKLIKTIGEKEDLKSSLEEFCKENNINIPESIKRMPDVIPDNFIKKIIYYIKKIWNKIKETLKKLFS